MIQVQAADINGSGGVPQDEFENNGLSEASTFSFGNPSEAPAMKLCKKPSNFLAEKLDEQSVQLTWQETNSEAPIDYLVSYRTENESFWNERIVADPSLILVQLAPSNYKFKVYSRCTYDNKSAFTNEMSVILESPKPEESPEVEPQDTYVNTDPEPVTPSEYETEQTKEPAINVFNTPIKIILDSEDLKNLPDSLQLPKGYEKLGSLPVLSDKPSIEDLKAALQTQKIDCASYLAGYSCGQHDAPAVPSGDIIQVKTGDEIAINSVGFEVVELDGSGNGKGIVKVSMFNNAKFGVEFKGIKVAKGGCVVAGEAILSNVDMALLSEEQRKKLAETYATFTKVLAIADSLAPQIAETYNSIADLLKAVRAKAKIVIDKIAKNEKPSTKELKDLAKLSETAINAKKKELEGLKKQAGADTSKYVASLGTWLVKQDNALACVKTLPSSEPDTKTKKGGPFLEDDDYYGGCDITALTEEEPANVTNTPSQHYHISINMTTELWLDNEGKSFTKLYVDCIAKEMKEWTYFDATLNKLTEGKIYPFASNSFYVNQSSYEASKLGMPMAGKWGDNIVSIASTYVDDFTFLGRVLEFCPNLTNEKEVKYPWHSLFLGAKNHSKSADFAENVKTISDVTYALVDGYYLVRGIAKIGLGALAKTGFSTILGKEEYFLIHQKLELELKNVITQYRKEVNIFRSVGNNNKVVGGTVASGKIRIDNIGEKMYVGASSTAQKSGLKVVQRYKATNIALVNHAEQDLLGKIANDLDNSLGAGSKNASGQIFLNIEQEMCTSCSAGLKNPRATSGIIKQFSTEYKNIVLIIDDSAKKVIVKNGTIIN